MPWLEQHIWPAESQWLNESFVRDGTTLAVAEMLLAGTTTFSDMYFFPEASAEVAESHGVRAQINFPIIEFSSNWASDTEEYFAKGLDLFDNYRHSKLVSVGFGPHAPYTVSDASFERVAVLAEEIDTHIQIHLQESAAEVRNYTLDCTISRINQLLYCLESTRSEARSTGTIFSKYQKRSQNNTIFGCHFQYGS